MLRRVLGEHALVHARADVELLELTLKDPDLVDAPRQAVKVAGHRPPEENRLEVAREPRVVGYDGLDRQPSVQVELNHGSRDSGRDVHPVAVQTAPSSTASTIAVPAAEFLLHTLVVALGALHLNPQGPYHPLLLLLPPPAPAAPSVHRNAELRRLRLRVRDRNPECELVGGRLSDGDEDLVGGLLPHLVVDPTLHRDLLGVREAFGGPDRVTQTGLAPEVDLPVPVLLQDAALLDQDQLFSLRQAAGGRDVVHLLQVVHELGFEVPRELDRGVEGHQADLQPAGVGVGVVVVVRLAEEAEDLRLLGGEVRVRPDGVGQEEDARVVAVEEA
mmetsp:Transcript_21780/g.53334  ORF Transcript_21780/g.53334 Transcript_21780/m.53334 type:complete len:331 (-) Transcript_21780:179-1171(-)